MQRNYYTTVYRGYGYRPYSYGYPYGIGVGVGYGYGVGAPVGYGYAPYPAVYAPRPYWHPHHRVWRRGVLR